jgi:hypothetical protein
MVAAGEAVAGKPLMKERTLPKKCRKRGKAPAGGLDRAICLLGGPKDYLPP